MFDRFRLAPATNRDSLAHIIAEQSVAELLRQTGPNIAAMDAAEQQGYLRARALPIIRVHVERMIGDARLTIAEAQQVTTAACDRTVHWMARELEAPPVIAIPAPHVPLRIAA